MGRMLDALRRTEVSEGLSLRRQAEPATEQDREDESTIPFIEIGPRGTPTLASPGILANGPARNAVKTAPTAAPAVVELRALTEPKREPDAQTSGFHPSLVAWHEPDHALSKDWRRLWLEVRSAATGEGPQVFLFTAAKTGVGATTIVLNLAISAARNNDGDVLVLDRNAARPDVAERVGLQDAGSPEETAQAGLYVATAGSTDRAKLTRLLDRLRERYSIILVDAGPWDPETTPPLAAACDVALIVAPRTEEQIPATTTLLRAITRTTATLSGLILT